MAPASLAAGLAQAALHTDLQANEQPCCAGGQRGWEEAGDMWGLHHHLDWLL